MIDTDRLALSRQPLGLRLLGYILLVSSLVTLLLTAWQLWSDYQRDVDTIKDRFDIVEQTTLEPLANSIWALNEEQLGLLLTGMMNLEAVVGVELVTDQGRTYRLGETRNSALERHYQLTHHSTPHGTAPFVVGQLTLYATLDGVYDRLRKRTINILIAQGIKTFIVSFFIMLIIHRLITRHLKTIADYARGLSLSNLNAALTLSRHRRTAPPDELDHVETAMNYMRKTLLADTAKREEIEHRLMQSETRYRQMFDASIDGLVVLDLKSNVFMANPAWLAMTGYTLDQARGLHISEWTPAQWAAMESAIVDEQVLQRGYSDIYEKECIRRNGQIFPVSVRCWLIRNEHGHPQFLSHLVRDISQEKRLTKEREQLESQLRDSQRMETIGRLAGGIAHDFNNILTPIRGYAELLAKENPENLTIRNRSEAIFHAAERGRKLVDQVLLLSRKGSTQRSHVDFARIVRETLELATPTRPTNVRVTFESKAADNQLHGDTAQLHQLVLNIVINAFQAMEASGGTLQLEIREAASPHDDTTAGLQLRITDTGHGIAPENLNKIFEPFFSTSNAQGSGLGLAVAHGIVKSHGGEIHVDSSAAGSCFTIWLPRNGET